MIRLGLKPRLYFSPGYNDMSHWLYSSWEVNGGFFYVTDDMFMKFRTFTDPSLKEPKEVIPGSLESLLATPYAEKLKRAIDLNPNKSLIWQFNGLTRLTANIDDENQYVRHAVFLGEPNCFIIPTWFDVYVSYPVLKFLAGLLNKTLYFKHKQEKKAWDKVLEEIHTGNERQA